MYGSGAAPSRCLEHRTAGNVPGDAERTHLCGEKL